MSICYACGHDRPDQSAEEDPEIIAYDKAIADYLLLQGSIVRTSATEFLTDWIMDAFAAGWNYRSGYDAVFGRRTRNKEKPE